MRKLVRRYLQEGRPPFERALVKARIASLAGPDSRGSPSNRRRDFLSRATSARLPLGAFGPLDVRDALLGGLNHAVRLRLFAR